MSEPVQHVGSDLMDGLVKASRFAADMAALRAYRTDAERTRAVVRAALVALVENGLITVAPVECWPKTVTIDLTRS